MFKEKELSLKEAILLIRRVRSLLSYNEQQDIIALANKYQRNDYIRRKIKRCRGKIAKLQTELDKLP